MCDPNETTASCPTDCGQPPACNNDGTCQPTETAASCPADCDGGSGSGSGSGDFGTCFAMCITAPDPETCLATCLGGGVGGIGDDSACTGGAPDGTCDATEMQALPPTCITDCPLF
jgi:hypothetical protein